MFEDLFDLFEGGDEHYRRRTPRKRSGGLHALIGRIFGEDGGYEERDDLRYMRRGERRRDDADDDGVHRYERQRSADDNDDGDARRYGSRRRYDDQGDDDEGYRYRGRRHRGRDGFFDFGDDWRRCS